MDGLPLGDIIVFGAIAAFIILRYRSMLGEQRGRDASEIRKKAMEEVERIIQLPQKNDDEKPASPASDVFARYDASLQDTLKQCQKIDADFAPDGFLEGAKGAFEMLVSAYREGDRETLKMLLSKELYAQFDVAITEEEKKAARSQGTVIAISHADIIDASLKGSMATLTVKFVSDQIQVVRGADNVIIEGDPSHEVEIDDQWVFTRDLKSNNPNWVIIET